jgi:hypothetical protein
MGPLGYRWWIMGEGEEGEVKEFEYHLGEV